MSHEPGEEQIDYWYQQLLKHGPELDMLGTSCIDIEEVGRAFCRWVVRGRPRTGQSQKDADNEATDA